LYAGITAAMVTALIGLSVGSSRRVPISKGWEAETRGGRGVTI
jgi:hypothetical protein